MILLVQLVSSNQPACLTGVSGECRGVSGAAGNVVAITSDTSVCYLHWSFDRGVRKRPIERFTGHCGIEVLQFACTGGCRLPQTECSKVAARGELETIQSALGEECVWCKVLRRTTAASRNVCMVKWTRILTVPATGLFTARPPVQVISTSFSGHAPKTVLGTR